MKTMTDDSQTLHNYIWRIIDTCKQAITACEIHEETIHSRWYERLAVEERRKAYQEVLEEIYSVIGTREIKMKSTVSPEM